MRTLLASVVGLVLLTGGATAGGTQLRLPYELESQGRTVWIADGLRHQVLKLDLARGRVTVVAGTGAAGFSGDGGPATQAALDEPVGLALDRSGNLYVADIGNDRVRRVDRKGVITTVAKVVAPANLDVSPDGRRLAIASLEGVVHRLDLRTGRVSRLGRSDNPHGLAYDRDGTLLVAEQTGLRRYDARGRATLVARGDFVKVHVAPTGAVYVVSGSPTGGHVDRVVRGRLVRVAGTGGLTPYRAAQPALKAGLLPSDVEVLRDGTVLVTQGKPQPALRRLSGGRLVTILR